MASKGKPMDCPECGARMSASGGCFVCMFCGLSLCG
jgi:hypothetical protein